MLYSLVCCPVLTQTCFLISWAFYIHLITSPFILIHPPAYLLQNPEQSPHRRTESFDTGFRVAIEILLFGSACVFCRNQRERSSYEASRSCIPCAETWIALSISHWVAQGYTHTYMRNTRMGGKGALRATGVVHVVVAQAHGRRT